MPFVNCNKDLQWRHDLDTMEKLLTKIIKPAYRALDSLVRYLQTESTGAQLLGACSNVALRTGIIYDALGSELEINRVLGPLSAFEGAAKLQYARHKAELGRQLQQIHTVYAALKQYQQAISDVEDEIEDITSKTGAVGGGTPEQPLLPSQILLMVRKMRVVVASDILEKHALLAEIKKIELPSDALGVKEDAFTEISALCEQLKVRWYRMSPGFGIDTEFVMLQREESFETAHNTTYSRVSSDVWKFCGSTLSEYYEKINNPAAATAAATPRET